MLAIVNDAAVAYRGVIPADRWHEPYMSESELREEIVAGVEFWGVDTDEGLVGIMGVQPARDVDLIRHAYVRTDKQRYGVGAELIEHLRRRSTRRMLVSRAGPCRIGIAAPAWRPSACVCARRAICGRRG